MMAGKYLVLSFLTTGGKEHKITINNPKDGLTRSQVNTAMESIISSTAFLAADGDTLDSVNDLYYREISVTVLTDPGGAE